jgi:hypothetical protein
MTSPIVPRPLRRALAVGGLLLATALAAHAAAGGGLPSVGALVVPAGLSSLVAAVLTSGAPRRVTALALVSASQYATHSLLVLSAARSAEGAAAGPGHGRSAPLCAPGHGHGAVVECVAAGGAAGATASWSDTTMLALHVAATLATGLLLAQGDRVLGWLLAVVRPGWRRRLARVHPVRLPGRSTVVGPPLAALTADVWVRLRPRRGPPRRRGVVRLATT